MLPDVTSTLVPIGKRFISSRVAWFIFDILFHHSSHRHLRFDILLTVETTTLSSKIKRGGYAVPLSRPWPGSLSPGGRDRAAELPKQDRPTRRGESPLPAFSSWCAYGGAAAPLFPPPTPRTRPPAAAGPRRGVPLFSGG